jgi:hypothetical protein
MAANCTTWVLLIFIVQIIRPANCMFLASYHYLWCYMILQHAVVASNFSHLQSCNAIYVIVAPYIDPEYLSYKILYKHNQKIRCTDLKSWLLDRMESGFQTIITCRDYDGKRLINGFSMVIIYTLFHLQSSSCQCLIIDSTLIFYTFCGSHFWRISRRPSYMKCCHWKGMKLGSLTATYIP